MNFSRYCELLNVHFELQHVILNFYIISNNTYIGALCKEA